MTREKYEKPQIMVIKIDPIGLIMSSTKSQTDEADAKGGGDMEWDDYEGDYEEDDSASSFEYKFGSMEDSVSEGLDW